MTLHKTDGWTLFLDRDGVINERPPEHEHVERWEDFVFIGRSLRALFILSPMFKHIFIVTNQAGVEMSAIENIHDRLMKEIHFAGGEVDGIYCCNDTDEQSSNRKPHIGMAIRAKQDFPDIDFSKSVMVGDSQSDMEFGKRLGMFRIFIGSTNKHYPKDMFDGIFHSLYDFATHDMLFSKNWRRS